MIDAWFEAYNSGDRAVFAAVFGPDAETFNSASGSQFPFPLDRLLTQYEIAAALGEQRSISSCERLDDLRVWCKTMLEDDLTRELDLGPQPQTVKWQFDEFGFVVEQATSVRHETPYSYAVDAFQDWMIENHPKVPEFLFGSEWVDADDTAANILEYLPQYVENLG